MRRRAVCPAIARRSHPTPARAGGMYLVVARKRGAGLSQCYCGRGVAVIRARCSGDAQSVSEEAGGEEQQRRRLGALILKDHRWNSLLQIHEFLDLGRSILVAYPTRRARQRGCQQLDSEHCGFFRFLQNDDPPSRARPSVVAGKNDISSNELAARGGMNNTCGWLNVRYGGGGPRLNAHKYSPTATSHPTPTPPSV